MKEYTLKRFVWFFPILRIYGFNHWYNHTNGGQILQWTLLIILIVSALSLAWFVMSTLIISNASYGYYLNN